jgi:LDH2 family malate/lactate/ureidoglycolate dehydrogenase
MTALTNGGPGGAIVRIEDLDGFCRAALAAVGADAATVAAATAGMMHASRLGVDSHGVRLLDHYLRGLSEGRLNRRPHLRLLREHGATAVLDADHAQGALAAYTGMEHAVRLARAHGTGAVAIRNSSHFGPAGAYALRAAEEGMVGLAVCNSDSFVRLHDGAARFHGTNPFAVAVPVPEGEPWLFDMATSSVPYNRVLLYRGLDRLLPAGVASDEDGVDTTDPHAVAMLAPLGGADFGFKGAGIGGFVEILSAVLAGMRLSHEIAPMGGPDFSTPREMGAFCLALDPGAFLPRAEFEDGMRRYLAALRTSPSRAGGRVMAPGDREWEEAERRRQNGIPIDPATLDAFRRIADEYGLSLPLP